MSWTPPPDWIRLTTVDAHAAGEPLRIVTSGYPRIEGTTMLEKRRFARERLDHLRRMLIDEPRGHADMYACALTEPVTEDADFGVLFMHNEGYSTMCGHAVVALVTAGIELGLFATEPTRDTVEIDTPAGRVSALPRIEGGRVRAVSFRNVPSFALALDREVEVEGLGRVRYDLAFGGAFYAYIDAASVGVSIRPDRVGRIVEAAMAIKRAVARSFPIRHPEGPPDLDFLYGVILVDRDERFHSRNVCVFADGEVDRSPTGTGVSGRIALSVARGEAAIGESLRIASILGTTFDVRAVERCRVGGFEAVVPEVTGSAHVTGRHEFLLDPEDPVGVGFRLRSG